MFADERLGGAGSGQENDDETSRRVHPRVAGPPILVSGLWGKVKDISLTGLCVLVDTPLRHGDCFDLVLTDSLSRENRWIPAEVQWYSRGQAGLRWIDLEPEDQNWLVDRFRRWLEHCQQELRELEGQMSDPPETGSAGPPS